MEASETPPTSDVDLGTEERPDPFAEHPADPLADELPPGVQPGSLQGDNPSEMEPVADESAAEYDPETEQDDPELVPDEERPAEQDEEEGPVADEPAPEPSAEVDEPETPVPGSENGEKSASPPEPEPEKPSKPARKAKKSTSKKAGKGAKKETASIRGYVILRAGEEPGDWTEAFERPEPKPEGADTMPLSDEPYVLQARNGTTALRAAYRLLAASEDEPQEYLLIAVPHKLWNPQIVRGRVHKQEAISVG